MSAPARAGTSFLIVAGSIAIALMMLHISADVLCRWIVGVPIVGTLEYVTFFYMVAVVFLPLARVQEERGHVLVEVVSNLLPARVNHWIDWGAQLFSFAYIAFIGWWGWEETARAFSRNEVVTIIQTDVPMWPSRLMVPLGCGAMALVLLVQLAQGLRGDAQPPRGSAAH